MDGVEGFSDIRINDVHRLDFVVPSEEVDAALLRTAPEMKVQVAHSTLTEQEETDMVPAVTIFTTPSILANTSCYAHLIYGGVCSWGNFFVTDDHRFFKIFLQSAIAEECSQCLCQDARYPTGHSGEAGRRDDPRNAPLQGAARAGRLPPLGAAC